MPPIRDGDDTRCTTSRIREAVCPCEHLSKPEQSYTARSEAGGRASSSPRLDHRARSARLVIFITL